MSEEFQHERSHTTITVVNRDRQGNNREMVSFSVPWGVKESPTLEIGDGVGLEMETQVVIQALKAAIDKVVERVNKGYP